MIYDYVIQNSQGDVITSREFPIRIRGQRPAYGSFSINNPGTYRIAWTYGGWDLVMMNVNGTYTYVERQNGRDVKTFYQTFSVVEKEKVQQNVIVSTLSQKTYGDQHFYIEIEDDNEELGDFSFSSSNTDVAKIYSDGGIYIKGAGTTDITVSRSGDDDFYNYTYTQTFTVKKRNITVNANPASKKVG